MSILRHPRAESGFSMVEVLVATVLFSAVVAVMGPVMTSALRSGHVAQNESRAIDEIRIAVGRIDRELRSAECITTPAAGQSGSVLTFTTYASGALYTVTYAVSDGRVVRTVGTDTQYVAEGVVGTSQEFRHAAANPGRRDSVTVELNVRFEEDHAPRVVTTTIAGRNAWVACP